MPNKSGPKDWSNWIIAGIAGMSLLGTKVYDSFSYKETLATKPYVDDRFDQSIKHTDLTALELRKYVDDKTAGALDKAIAHSDSNHQDMVLRVDHSSSESRSSQAVLSTKIDSIINIIQDMRDQGVVYKKRPSK